jgi:LPXTG-motif cell wall-anchored protein
VTLTEQAPATVADASWSAGVFSAAGAKLATANAVTIVSGERAEVLLTNTLTRHTPLQVAVPGTLPDPKGDDAGSAPRKTPTPVAQNGPFGLATTGAEIQGVWIAMGGLLVLVGLGVVLVGRSRRAAKQ